ncbi:hypothetical protein BDV18DRAFT_20195 [Aspergillus unguis]
MENSKWWPGAEHEFFTQWAISQGITVNGVGPARFPGRGLGMIAKRSIQANEEIVKVPRQAMLTVEAIPPSFLSKFPEETPVHALLAAYLCYGDPKDLEPYSHWRKTWPTWKDFAECMPLLWPEIFRNQFLPPSISGAYNMAVKRGKTHIKYDTPHQNLLEQQVQRLTKAWEIVSSVFPDSPQAPFNYYWLIVNTRSFHYLMPGQDPPEDRNDAMAMVPFADYFNHSDVACNVKFDGQEYVFRAAKAYEPGEEIYMSYGPHSNDFLLTEYGFFLDRNEFETLYLDDIIFKDLNSSLQEELNLQQYLGNYQLTASGVCYRTEIAAGIEYMRLEDWQNYVLGHSDEGVDAQQAEEIIRGWIRAYQEQARLRMNHLESDGRSNTSDQHSGIVQMLMRRWMQIEDLCRIALKNVSC